MGASGEFALEPFPQFVESGDGPARNLFVAAEIEEGVLEDGADHPHQVHFRRARDAEDPAGGARRDQPGIAIDQIEPPARQRLVEQALGLGLDQSADVIEIDRRHRRIELRPLPRHDRAAVQTEDEGAVHLFDARAVDRGDPEIEIAPQHILDLVPAHRDPIGPELQHLAISGGGSGPQALDRGAEQIGLQRPAGAARRQRRLRRPARNLVRVENQGAGAARAHLFNESPELGGQRLERRQLRVVAWRNDDGRHQRREHDVDRIRLLAADKGAAAPAQFGLDQIAGFPDVRGRFLNELRRQVEAPRHEPSPDRIEQEDERPLPQRRAVDRSRIERRPMRQQVKVDQAADRQQQASEQTIDQSAICRAGVIALAIEPLARP